MKWFRVPEFPSTPAKHAC